MANDAWLDDILEEMGWPNGVRVDWLRTKAVANGENDSDVRRKLGNALGRCGYVMYKNPALKDGRWKIGDKKVTVYARAGCPDFDPVSVLFNEPF